MALLKEDVCCPFCSSTTFNVSLSMNDMPRTDEPTEPAVTLELFCRQCGNNVFLASKTHGGQVSAMGVSMCRRCKEPFVKAPNAEDADRCPKCGGGMERCWWHVTGFTV